MTEKKPLFSIGTEQNAALQMLGGKKETKTETKPTEPIQVKETIKEEIVKEQVQVEKSEDAPVKKKTNRGRKRKYEEGEVAKLTVLVEKHLSTTLKTLAKSKGKTIQQVMMPYIQEWLEKNQPVENPYFSSENKKYTGFLVPTEFRESFSEACTDREITQSFVMEALYNQAINDLMK